MVEVPVIIEVYYNGIYSHNYRCKQFTWGTTIGITKAKEGDHHKNTQRSSNTQGIKWALSSALINSFV